ncbi:MAG: hypothetical protein RR575_00080 [Acinetobacter sp.]
MNTNPKNTLPLEVRDCSMISTIQMFFEFIDRRHFENALSASSIKSAEDYLAEIQHYVEMCSKYTHLHASVDIANRYLSVATFLVKQMKEA